MIMIRQTAISCGLAGILFVAPAGSAEIAVHGLMEGRATISVNKSKPKTLRAGEAFQGVKLISANTQSAVVEIEGKRRTVTFGEAITTGTASSGAKTVTLVSDSQGHFVSLGAINGASMRFLVDTGATMVSMDVEAARRAGVNYLQGERGFSTTANGVTPVYKVKLDTVQLGDITLNNVDGIVHTSSSLPVVLLGMSFLGRLQMRQEGDLMTLTRKHY
jgi:aspartyl protease family protein